MDNNKTQAQAEENQVQELTPEERKKQIEELQKQLKANLDERKRKKQEASQALKEGRGILSLETPILAGDKNITELVYDFNELTGMDYIDAMDSDPNAQQIFKITYRQALALFAKAAAKETEYVDMRDILERIGMTDAVEAVQLATLFFSASTRAGQLRISKRS